MSVGSANKLYNPTTNTYENGSYYLKYENLTNAITTVDNLTESYTINNHALSAHQGYVLDRIKFDINGSNKFKGDFVPYNAYLDIGTSSNYWSSGYIGTIYTNYLYVNKYFSLGNSGVITANISNITIDTSKRLRANNLTVYSNINTGNIYSNQYMNMNIRSSKK